MRFLIHYVGDVHQPLHAETMVDKTFPKGDLGGNFFSLPVHFYTKNLHAVWDKVLYEPYFKYAVHLPMSDSDWAKNGEMAT